LLGSCFLLASLGLGLTISAIARAQFVAAMVSLIVGFLPAFFLSGLLFDLESMPEFIQKVSLIIPARYFVQISQTLFMAGNVGAVLWPAGAILAGMAALLLGITRVKVKGRLPQ
jgi:ABC-2 type transport system permease protein